MRVTMRVTVCGDRLFLISWAPVMVVVAVSDCSVQHVFVAASQTFVEGRGA